MLRSAGFARMGVMGVIGVMGVMGVMLKIATGMPGCMRKLLMRVLVPEMHLLVKPVTWPDHDEHRSSDEQLNEQAHAHDQALF